MPIHLAVALVAALIATPASGTVTHRPGPAEVDVPETFRLAEATFGYETRPLRRTPRYTVEGLTFPSPVETPDVSNNTVHAEYFRPIGPGKRPGVIVLHILGADFALSRYIAARLADRGVAALFVKLPYYGERRPPGADARFLSTDPDRSIRSMRQGVLDVRRAAAWLGSRDEVDPGRLGVTGISLGGIVSSVAAAVDPSLNSAAFVLAGGDLHEILWVLPEGKKYKQLWIDSGRTKADLKALTAPFDPVTHAARLKGKRILMIAGNVDEVIPPDSARALWHAAGEPPMIWLDCGHYSAGGYFLPAIRRVVDHFADRP